MVGIYKITSPSGKVYIGQSWDIGRRLYDHSIEKRLRSKLYSSIQKYGFDNHKSEIVHELPIDVDQETLDRYEQLYMDAYRDCGGVLLNIREAGSRGRLGESTLAKISIVRKKYYRENPDKAKAAFEIISLANKQWREENQDQVDAQMSVCREGYKKWCQENPELRREINKSAIKKFKAEYPDAFRAIYMKSAEARRGKKLSEAHRLKIVARVRVSGCRRKAVDQYSLDGTFIKSWPSFTEAGRVLGISRKNIEGCAYNKPGRKTAGGFKWTLN